MSDERVQSLGEAVKAVMDDKTIRSRYPQGPTTLDVLDEIRSKFGAEAWPYCTHLDVYDELSALYGRQR